MTESTELVPLKRKGGFVKGVSGNPNGRPKGTKNAITLAKIALEGELRKQLSYDMAEILQKAIEMAKAGDTAMIKLLVDKVLPTTRAADDESPQRERIQIVINKLPDVSEPIKVTSAKVIEGDFNVN